MRRKFIFGKDSDCWEKLDEKVEKYFTTKAAHIKPTILPTSNFLVTNDENDSL